MQIKNLPTFVPSQLWCLVHPHQFFAFETTLVEVIQPRRSTRSETPFLTLKRQWGNNQGVCQNISDLLTRSTTVQSRDSHESIIYAAWWTVRPWLASLACCQPREAIHGHASRKGYLNVNGEEEGSIYCPSLLGSWGLSSGSSSDLLLLDENRSRAMFKVYLGSAGSPNP